MALFFDQAVLAWNEHSFQIASRTIRNMFPDPIVGYVAGANVVEHGEAWLLNHGDQHESFLSIITECISDATMMLAAQAADARG